MKIGDLVKRHRTADFESAQERVGIVVGIDKEFFGARQAFKTRPVPRGCAIVDTRKPEFIAPTRDGIRDRVMICWPDHGFTYEDSMLVEVISEG